MAIRFDVPVDPHLQMTGIVDGLTRAGDPDQPAPASSYFSHALYGLIGLESSKSAGMVASPESTSRFRETVSDLLVEQAGNFQAFCWDTYNFALNGANGEWYKACLGRSVLQILLDDFKGTAAADLIGPEEVEEIEEIDDLLRAAAPDAAPLEGVLLPPGMPADHWWWFLPSGPPAEPDPEP
nr:hypothetical protein [Kibdelosporangium sp. MJ126-NF4]